ncbi:ubiquinol--cytochrome-c reductase subunit 8 [Malassezia yamatoensis]|uniref:Cytochrome b-c1 complex subunit 8 n=1 Tax=Malassezia yamatoensis TaxID=253288 RepID=A0AAJ6CIT2_9BASI|nr:ubiquinol--cytochrome-c reductase subunit 8 [Malassezia yamatoensis]
MRASSVVRSGMPDGHKWIGWYGHFGGPTQKYIKTYAVSPFQQNPFAGVLKGYLFNGFRRVVANLPYSGLPFVVGYFVYTWGNQEFGYVNSKAGHIAHGGDHE